MIEPVSILFLCLAVVCNAIMDIVENENFFISIFKNLNQKFWYKRESWKYARKVFNTKLDAWHIFKFFMVLFICLSISPTLNGLIYGLIWNVVFEVTYRIFK